MLSEHEQPPALGQRENGHQQQNWKSRNKLSNLGTALLSLTCKTKTFMVFFFFHHNKLERLSEGARPHTCTLD